MISMITIENVGSQVTAADMTTLLAQHEGVKSVKLGKELTPGTDTRVVFVTMQSDRYGHAVIAALDGKEHWGHALTVKALKARDRGGDSGTNGFMNREGRNLNKGSGRVRGKRF